MDARRKSKRSNQHLHVIKTNEDIVDTCNEEPDEDWLSGTLVPLFNKVKQRAENVRQQHRLKKKQKKTYAEQNEHRLEDASIENVPEISIENVIQREDRVDHEQHESCTPEVTGDLSSQSMEEDTKIRSYRDVTEFDHSSNTSRNKRKRRQRDSHRSSLCIRSDLSEQDYNAQSIENLSENNTTPNSCLFDNEDEIAPLPALLSHYYSCFDSEASYDDDEFNDLSEEQTYFEETCKDRQNDDEISDDEMILNGLELSDRFVFSTFRLQKCKNDVYSPFLTKDEALKLCKENPQKYKHCKINIENSQLATCTNLDTSDDVKFIDIIGQTRRGRTFDNDEVIVEIENKQNNKSYKSNERKKCTSTQKTETIFGKILCITKRNRFADVPHPVFACIVDEYNTHLMKPLCKTVPKIKVLNSKCKTNHEVEIHTYNKVLKSLKFEKLKPVDDTNRREYIFLVCMITWENSYMYPLGAVIKVFRSNSFTSALKTLRFQYQVPTLYTEKTKLKTLDILQKGESETKMIEELSGKRNACTREDISSTVTAFTIDPPGSKDLDDALSIRETELDVYEIGVHIADVASIVKINDDVDIEAQERSVTFYPGERQRAHHMLPEPIGNGICSLLPGQKRRAISVFFTMDKHGKELKKPIVKPTIVKSIKQFTYQEIQSIISKGDETELLHKSILTLARIAQAVRSKRIGLRKFAFPFEPHILESENSYYATSDAHDTVEEFMLKTNIYIADFLSKYYPKCIPLRVQKSPKPEEVIDWLQSYFSSANLILKLQNQILPNKIKLSLEHTQSNNPLAIQLHIWQKIVESLKTENYTELKRLIGCDKVHPAQAIAYNVWVDMQESTSYECSGDLTPAEKQHFSLGVPFYVQCTSPLRRYIDLVVQRLIHSVLNQHPNPPYSKKELSQICQKANKSKMRAKDFQRQSKNLRFAIQLKKKSVVVHAMVNKVFENKLSVHVPGMRLPSHCNEIPYHLMRVNKQPILLSNKTSPSVWRLNFRHRIYSTSHHSTGEKRKKKGKKKTKTRHNRIPRGKKKEKNEKEGKKENENTTQPDYTQIDLNQRLTFVTETGWRKIIDAVIGQKHGTVESLSLHSNLFKSNSILSCSNAVKDVNSEVWDEQDNLINQYCDFSLSFKQEQIIPLVLSAELVRGVPSPVIQMLDVTNNVKFCLQHTSDPVKTFASYASQQVHPACKDPDEYIRRWLSIYRMESAVRMMEGMPIMINDLQVNFTSDEISECVFKLTKAFCKKRYLDLKTLDSVCIRCDFVRGIPIPLGTEINSNCPPSDRTIWISHGTVTQVDDCKVYFRLNNGSPKPTPEMLKAENVVKYNVEIIQKFDHDRRVEASLAALSEESSMLARAIVFGLKLPKLDETYLNESVKIESDVTNCSLPPNNQHQKAAIRRALSSSFSLIHGPPGTGKTSTAIKLVCRFVGINAILREKGGSHKQVVFCGQSNKSVDLAARLLMKRFGENAPTFVRIYGTTLENRDYKLPVMHNLFSLSNNNYETDPKLKHLSLHHLIRQKGKPHAKKIKDFEDSIRSKKGIPFEVMNDFLALLCKASQEEIKQYDVIFCTTAVATSKRFLNLTENKIYQLIIDEAGMCTEPETIATIVATQATQVVLIGDHKQLQPTVCCKDAAKLGLTKSLFERLSQHAVFLNYQYRMNPKLCKFPSSKFYSGRLESQPSKAWIINEPERPLSIWRETSIPMAFCHLEGEEETLSVRTEEGNQQSRYNKAEVEYVRAIYTGLVRQEGLLPNRINIMSQYNAQCFAIREALKKERFINYNVNTVAASQGGEWDYVIFSTVRSIPKYRIEPNPTIGWLKHNLGFILDSHQINVALTRARKGLIIVGNKNLLKCDPVWEKLLLHYARQGCLEDADSFTIRALKPKRRKKRNIRESPEEEFYMKEE